MKKAIYTIFLLLMIQMSFGQGKYKKPVYDCDEKVNKNSVNYHSNLKNCKANYQRALDDYNKNVKHAKKLYTNGLNNVMQLNRKQEHLFTSVRDAVNIVQSANNLEEFKQLKKKYEDLLGEVRGIEHDAETHYSDGLIGCELLGKSNCEPENIYNRMHQRANNAIKIKSKVYHLRWDKTDNNSNSITKSNYSSDNSSYSTQESIYEKRRIEANTKEQREEKIRQDRLRKAKEIEKETQRNINRIENATRQAQKGIDDLFSNWAREEDFRKKVNSLTNINSVDASGIIAETKYKVQEINNLYSQRKNKLMNMSLDALNKLMNSSQNESQLITNTAIGAGITVFSQVSADSQRKKLIKALEEEKNKKLNELANKVKAKYQPAAESYLQKAKYAVIQDEENYYLKQYEYNKCMIDNSLSVVLGKESCTKPQIKSFTRKSIYTGKDYYNAFLSKGKSAKLIDKAEYFLELALEKEPNNYEWLKEKYKILDKTNLKDKIIILNRFISLKPNKSEYRETLKSLNAKLKLSKEVNVFKIEDLIKNRENYNWDKHNGLMRYYENNKHYFINKDKEIVLRLEGYEFQYKFRNEYNQYGYDLGHDEYNEGLLRVTNNAGEYGFLDTNSNIAIPLLYKRATKFNDGIAAVQSMDSGKWGFINKKGEVVIDFIFHKANYFSENLAFVKLASEKKGKEKSAYININGEIAFEGKFDSGEPFSNGAAVVTKYGKGSFMGGSKTKSYYINSEGKRLNKHNYAKALPYNKSGTAIVGKSGWMGNILWTIVDKSGSPITDEKFQYMPTFTNGVAKVNIGSLTKRKYVLINEKGEIITKKINKESFTKIVSKAKTSKEVKNILLKHYDEVRKTKDGFIVKLVDKVGFADLSGKIIIPVNLHTLGEFHEGLAVFKKVYKKCGYMNIKGEVVIREKYFSCGNFSEGLATVVKVSTFSRKGGYINKKGRVVIPLQYYTVNPFVNGKAEVNAGSYNNPNVYYIDKKGRKLTE